MLRRQAFNRKNLEQKKKTEKEMKQRKSEIVNLGEQMSQNNVPRVTKIAAPKGMFKQMPVCTITSSSTSSIPGLCEPLCNETQECFDDTEGCAWF